MENFILTLFFAAMLSLSGGLWSLSVELKRAQKQRLSARGQRF